MRPLPRFVRLSQCALVVMALVLSVAADGNAQSHEWLLGNWAGTFGEATTPGMSSGSGTLTVREEAGTLKWTWTGVVSGAGKTEAEGVVTKVDASSAELQGKLTSHYIPTYSHLHRCQREGESQGLTEWPVRDRVERADKFHNRVAVHQGKVT